MTKSLPEYFFHGTGIYCLANIILEDGIKNGVHWGKPNEPHGPRFSSEFDIAAQFIEYNLYFGEGGVLVLDTHKLAEDYEIQEYQDHYYTGEQMSDEKEYAAITEAVVPLSKYLVGIICDPHVIEEGRERRWMESAASEGGWPFDTNDAGYLQANKALDILSNHLLLNAWMNKKFEPPLMGNFDFCKIDAPRS